MHVPPSPLAPLTLFMLPASPTTTTSRLFTSVRGRKSRVGHASPAQTLLHTHRAPTAGRCTSHHRPSPHSPSSCSPPHQPRPPHASSLPSAVEKVEWDTHPRPKPFSIHIELRPPDDARPTIAPRPTHPLHAPRLTNHDHLTPLHFRPR